MQLVLTSLPSLRLLPRSSAILLTKAAGETARFWPLDGSCFQRAAATLLAVILEASCERGSEGELPFSQGEVEAAEDGGGGDDELELEDSEDVEAAAEGAMERSGREKRKWRERREEENGDRREKI